MPLISDYGTLKTQVAATLHRSDLADQMDNAAEMVRTEIVELGRMWDNFNFALISETDRYNNGPMYDLPDDLAELLEIYTGDIDTVDLVPNGPNVYGQLNLSRQQVWNELRNKSATPVSNYRITPDSANIVFTPNPAVNSNFIIYYILFPPAFLIDADTTQLLINRPQIYLYGMCKHLAIFTQNLELAEVYQQLFQVAIQQANDQALRVTQDGPIQVEGASNWH